MAFEAYFQGLFRDLSDDIDLPEERVFIVSRVDYCNKYDMAYALMEGSVGAHFNDSTTIVLDDEYTFLDLQHTRRAEIPAHEPHHCIQVEQ